jgi:hypothetical protein
MTLLGRLAQIWFRRPIVKTEPEDITFRARLDRISNLIAYQQPLDRSDPLEVVAAQLRMEWNQ